MHPDLRGLGLGKLLMLETERYCRESLGKDTAYLCTVDAHAFYSRLGYAPCPPVCAYGGSLQLPDRFVRAMGQAGSEAPMDPPALAGKEEGPGSTNSSIAPDSLLPPPPPPQPPPPPPSGLTTLPPPVPPPPPADKTAQASEEEDIEALCKKLFKRTTWSDFKQPPLLESPPRALPETPKVPKASKETICRATLKKDFMKKVL